VLCRQANLHEQNYVASFTEQCQTEETRKMDVGRYALYIIVSYSMTFDTLKTKINPLYN